MGETGEGDGVAERVVPRSRHAGGVSRRTFIQGVSTVGAATAVLAAALRYGLAFDVLFGRFGPAAAFAAGALLASALTFSVNARLVFAAGPGTAAGASDADDTQSVT